MPTLQLCLEEETGHRPGRAVHLHPAPPPRRRLIIAGLLLPGVVAAPALRLVTARKSASSEILILNIPISDPSSFAQKPAPTPAPSARLEQCAHSLNPIVVVLCSKPFLVFLSTTQPAKLPPRKCGRAPTACKHLLRASCRRWATSVNKSLLSAPPCTTMGNCHPPFVAPLYHR